MQEVLKKLEEQDQKFAAISDKLTEHGKRFDKIDERFDKIDERFDKIDERFNRVDERFDQTESQIDLLAKKMLDHEDQMQWLKDNMATRADISNITNTLDKIVKLYENKDQETAFLAHGLRKLEDKVEAHDKDIKVMKPLLGLT